KLPAVPLHNWLPDAHSQAPTAGSVVLAALLLKTGAYGLIRFVLPFFPEAAREFAPVAMLLGVIGILYGALLAYGQTDLKRLVAYTSVSHMGFVLLGIFSGNRLALQGTVIEMICHGISTGALFVIAGMLYERMHTRDLSRMGGLWPALPRLGGFAMVFVMASLGLPGLGNFVGEILILIGVYRAHATFAVLATIGVVGATIYSLAIMQRVFHGPAAEADHAASPGSAGVEGAGVHLRDLSAREVLVLAVLVVAIVGLGLFPQPVLNAARPALDAMSGWIGAG
ncbi:MAG: NADH-quinone oxidoreductase subunit M, partial [Candidatus Eisenbacteria bacterium]